MNIDPAIRKNAAIAVDVTDAGISGNNAFHSFRICSAGRVSAGQAGHRFSLTEINGLLPSHARQGTRSATFFYTPTGMRLPNGSGTLARFKTV